MTPPLPTPLAAVEAMALPSDGPLGDLIEAIARSMEGAMPNQFKHASPILARAALKTVLARHPGVAAVIEGSAVVVPRNERQFAVLESGGDVPNVKIEFETREDAWAFFSALNRAPFSPYAPPAPGAEGGG